MTHAEQAVAFFRIPDPHHNCAQSVLMPFAKQAGLTEEQAYALAANFGSGMRHGSTCGAVTGALMALGILGYGTEESHALLQAFREKEGDLTCANLLAIGKEKGLGKRDHCAQMVAAAAAWVAELTDK